MRNCPRPCLGILAQSRPCQVVPYCPGDTTRAAYGNGRHKRERKEAQEAQEAQRGSVSWWNGVTCGGGVT
jgi:hypothetical protein